MTQVEFAVENISFDPPLSDLEGEKVFIWFYVKMPPLKMFEIPKSGLHNQPLLRNVTLQTKNKD